MSSFSSRELRQVSTGPDLFLGDPLLGINRQFNRIFDGLLKGSLWPLSAAVPAFPSSPAPLPQLDIEEKEGEICVTAELPGVQQSDVEISLDGDILKICGEKKSGNAGNERNFRVQERSLGRFERTLQLPFAPDPDKVEAQFENGVLTIRLPEEQQEPTRRTIEIRSSSSPRAGAESAKTESGRPGDGQSPPSVWTPNAGGSSGSSSRSGGDKGGTDASSGGPSSSKNLSGSESSRKQPLPT